MSHECVSCLEKDDENGDVSLYETNCGSHFMCAGCLEQIFQMAMDNEAYYPPKCCSHPASVLLIDRYEEVLPFELYFNYKSKEHGEYSINARFRVYCGNTQCGKFVRPELHITRTIDVKKPGLVLSGDIQTSVTYDENDERTITGISEKTITFADCDACKKKTCVSCKALISDGIEAHECKISSDEAEFKKTVEEEGYQKCYNCTATVELMEACNHISCECGSDFCYVCGKAWEGLHGCPHYGPATYDAEGYNQDGFHEETGLNREGRTRRQQIFHDGLDPVDGVEDEDHEDDDDDDNAGNGHGGHGRIPLPQHLQWMVDNGWISFQDAFEQVQLMAIENGDDNIDLGTGIFGHGHHPGNGEDDEDEEDGDEEVENEEGDENEDDEEDGDEDQHEDHNEDLNEDQDDEDTENTYNEGFNNSEGSSMDTQIDEEDQVSDGETIGPHFDQSTLTGVDEGNVRIDDVRHNGHHVIDPVSQDTVAHTVELEDLTQSEPSKAFHSTEGTGTRNNS